MQTVNFQCGHCGKLMAVGVEHVGQQVRCPHCQQVVLAPAAPAPAPPPQPAPSPFGDLNRGEDIFSVPSETEDVLFGGADAPRLELPRHEAAVSFPPAGPELEPINPAPPVPDPSAGYSPPTEAPQEESFSSPPTWHTAGAEAPHPAETSPAPEPVGFAPTPRVRRPEPGGFVSPMFLLLVFLPVLLWALGATLIGVWLYTETLKAVRSGTDSFEALPDGDGDAPGIRKGKVQLRNRLQIDKAFAGRSVPADLQVKLGETVRVGELEVTPLKVIRQKVGVFVEPGGNPEPCLYHSLVLYMKIKNLSDTYSFTPVDNFFDRYYSGGTTNVPLTLLQAGKKTFYGGPCKWYPEARSKLKSQDREWLDLPGRKNYNRVGLRPGESMEACVCTDGGETAAPIALHLFGETGQDEKKQAPYKGELIWHVHLRRGPYRHKGRTVSATCVIGVQFDDTQIQR